MAITREAPPRRFRPSRPSRPLRPFRLPQFPSFLDANRLLIGTVSIALIVGACAFAFAFGALGLGKSQYSMSGVFTDASGISKGADVQMAGISVGTVSGIHPDFQAGQVIITWKVNKGVRLGPMTTADLALQNLLGGQYIRLSGPVQPPYMQSLPAGQRRIPLERTHTSLSVTGVLSSTAQNIQQINPATVNQVLVELTGVVGGSQKTFGPLLTNLATVASAINQRDTELRQLVKNTQQLTATLASKNQQLGQLIDSARGLLNELVTRRDQLSTILGAGSDAVVQLSDVISTERVHLRSIIDDTHVGILAASQELPQISQGFAWTGPTFTDLGAVNPNGPVDSVLNNVTSPVAGDFLTLIERTLTGKTG